MRKSHRSQSLFATALIFAGTLFSACHPIPEFKTPDIPSPQISLDQNTFMACNRKETEQPAVSSEVLQRKIVVEDEIATKDLEYIGCEGEVTSTGHGPERNLSKLITVKEPTDFSEPVQYVSVENFRTCAVFTFDAKDKDHRRSKDFPWLSYASRSGLAQIQLSDSEAKVNFYLNVRDGLNVLKIRYFGRCEKVRSPLAPDTEKDSFINCEKGKEIGSQDVVLSVNVHRPEVSGKKQLKFCEKK